MFPAATPQYIWPSYKISHRVAPLHGPHYLRPAYKCPILSTKGQRKWKYKYFPLQILVQRFSPIILFTKCQRKWNYEYFPLYKYY